MFAGAGPQDHKMKFLFDASAVLQIIKELDEEKALRLFSENSMLDLTTYEVGNAIWKEHTLLHRIQNDEYEEFLTLLGKVISTIQTLSVNAQAVPEVGKLASKENITYYDAGYVRYVRRWMNRSNS